MSCQFTVFTYLKNSIIICLSFRFCYEMVRNKVLNPSAVEKQVSIKL